MSKRIIIISFLQLIFLLSSFLFLSEKVFSNPLNVLNQHKEEGNKEINLSEPVNNTPNKVDTTQRIENENIKEEEIPPSTAFIPLEKEPEFDLLELQENVIYPLEAKKAGIEGKVIVRVYINRNGKVWKTEIISSDSDILSQAAIDAVKKTAFTPAKLNNEPIGCWVSIPIIFKLK